MFNSDSNQFTVEFGSRILVAVTSGLLTVLLARFLDPSGYGLLFLAMSIFSVLGTFSRSGIAQSAARYLVVARDTNPTQIPSILRSSLLYNTVTIMISSLILYFYHENISQFLGEPELTPYLLIGIVYLAVDSYAVYFRIIFQGSGRILYSSVIYMVSEGSRLLFSLGLILFGFGAFGALVGFTISSTLSSIIGLVLMYHTFFNNKETDQPIGSRLRRKMIKYAVPLTVSSAAYDIDNRVDTILIGLFLNPVAVSYYYLSKQIVDLVIIPTEALGFTLSPIFGIEKSDSNINRISKVYSDAISYALLLYIPGSIGLILIAHPLINQLFGREYLGAIPVVQIMGLYTLILSINSLSDGALDYLGRAKERALVQGLTSGLNFILNLLLIPVIGIVGAAGATVATNALYTLVNIYLINSEIGVEFEKILINMTKISVITIVMGIGVQSFIEMTDGFLSLIGGISIGVLIWGILSVFSGLLDSSELYSLLKQQ